MLHPRQMEFPRKSGRRAALLNLQGGGSAPATTNALKYFRIKLEFLLLQGAPTGLFSNVQHPSGVTLSVSEGS